MDEVVSAEEINVKSGKDDQATVLISLSEMIKTHIQSLDRLRNELREQREMLEDGFINNEVFREHAEKAKEAVKQKSQTRGQIMQQPGVALIAQKIKSLATEIREKQMSLSDYLLEYQRLAGVNEVEDYEGQVREIINSAKAVKKAGKKG